MRTSKVNQKIYRAFAMETTDGFWIAELKKPLAINAPEKDQVEHLLRYAIIAECNLAFARMYGYRTCREPEGKPLFRFLQREDPRNLEAVRQFVWTGYKVVNVETHELDKNRIPHTFVNTANGIVSKGHLTKMWGTQRDTTDQRLSQQLRAHLLALLTPRERQILRLTASELSIKQIAAALKISAKTVEIHRGKMMRRLEVHNLAGLALLAARLGLIEITKPDL